MKFFRICRYYYLKFKRLQGDPQSLAWGTAIGVFIGISPTIPLHTILILAITFITRTSAIAAIISSWLVCNPLTYIPLYYFSMVVGNMITPYELNWQKIKDLIETLMSDISLMDGLKEILSLGLEAIFVMIFGGLVLALPFTILSYYFSLHFFRTMQLKRSRKNMGSSQL